ncbi:hypothetical protein KHA80_12970 [Anaerobacillus sp. HL2]|nr:hypothetical protein KHA80_12970 [Anaerobacillus sp. HL2]
MGSGRVKNGPAISGIYTGATATTLHVSYEQATDSWQYSFDDGTTWEPLPNSFQKVGITLIDLKYPDTNTDRNQTIDLEKERN